MNQNKNFSLGGFPPIYEIVSNIKKKEFVPNNILSIQSILSKRVSKEDRGNIEDRGDVVDDESINEVDYKISSKKRGGKKRRSKK